MSASPLQLEILYRGPLESCNYGCAYCPFAKKVDSREALARDRAALERFVEWIAARPADDAVSVLFTPWGEGLVRTWYQDALVRLTSLPQVPMAAIQTNLSCGLGWVDRCDPARLGLWTTYHPEWADRAAFLEKIHALHAKGVQVSVGMVGFRRFRDEVAAMRAALPSGVYLWINAVKSAWGEEASDNGPPEPYAPDDIARFTAIDPLFPVNAIHHPSLGRSCRAGRRSISVDGDGTMRRCHFVKPPIGNLYDPAFADALRERPCPNATCGCHIGYVHLDHLALRERFGKGLLPRTLPGGR